MGDSVYLPDMLQKFISEPFALRRALHQPRNIDEAHRGGRRLFRLVHLVKNRQPRIRHIHDADVRLDGAEGIILRLRPRPGNGVKQRALADVRQADNTDFQIAQF